MWTSYETGSVQGPFRPEHVKILSLTHSLAVTGKMLLAALERFPAFSEGLQYLKVWPDGCAACRALVFVLFWDARLVIGYVVTVCAIRSKYTVVMK